MQRVFSLKKQHAQTLEFQAIRSTNDCNMPVCARQVLHALVELLPEIDATQLNDTIKKLSQRKNS
ncbi:hypothetical protein NAK90_004192 [Salmonella enterica]|uniref:Uncharacterized protein n=2 Tax=Salmonella enterica TaxID=28901 RepID=A0A744IVZ8_SALER|nr:hypothetical protein [Salmonella enterica subsp. enterica serovar Java]EBR9314261.1 hypothetical protein [Salmonella enterica subsp. enterica serovar Muenchen]EDQ3993470.1 hypothetical protein [Salmonella enterica subsp. enterica]EDS8889816.1 hypothetical protein [Salmonella enterica]EDX3512365.1 hypothetical protein [Salmonella enterica subsp. enterica serovar Adelaide]EEE5037241.1 hypothetical protein [Salmonella enterica subsp. diarizonae]EHG9470832.1 hypothetical protein [Salmonella en